MSVSFNGLKSGKIVRTPDESAEDSVGFNMNNGNAFGFLRLLEVESSDEGMIGSLPVVDMVRAVQRAVASLDYRVDSVTRKPTEVTGALGCRFFEAGADEDYFRRRLAEFSELLADWIELGADEVSWS